MKHQKILIVEDSVKRGGTKIFTFYLVKRLKKGYSIVYLTRPNPIVETLKDNNLKVEYLHIPRFSHRGIGKVISRFWILLAMVFKILKTARKYRVSLIHSHNLYSNIASSIVAKLSGIPNVWHIRDLSLFTTKMGRLLGPRVARWASGFIVISRYTEQRIKEYKEIHHLSGFARLVYNGIDTYLFRPLSEQEKIAVLRRLDIEDNKRPILGFVGRLEQPKGIDNFIYAAREITKLYPESQFLIVGEAYDDRYMRYLKNLIKKLKLKNIHFLGFQKKVWEIMGIFDILLFPVNKPEAFGLVMVESMSCGVPVISFNMGPVSEIVEDGKTGFIVEPENFKSIASKTAELWGNKTLYDTIRINCRERVKKIFPISKTIKEIEGVYRDILVTHP